MATNKSNLMSNLNYSNYPHDYAELEKEFQNQLLNAKIREYEKKYLNNYSIVNTSTTGTVRTVPNIEDLMMSTFSINGTGGTGSTGSTITSTVPITNSTITSTIPNLDGKTIVINGATIDSSNYLTRTFTTKVDMVGNRYVIDPKYFPDTYLTKDSYISGNIDYNSYNYPYDLIWSQTDIVSKAKVDETGRIYFYLNEYILNGKHQYSMYTDSNGKTLLSVSGSSLPVGEDDVVFSNQLDHPGSFFILSRQVMKNIDYLKYKNSFAKNVELNPEDTVEVVTVSPDHVHPISFNVDDLYHIYGIRGESLKKHVLQNCFLLAKDIISKRRNTNKNSINNNEEQLLPTLPILETPPAKAPSSTQLELF